jgi:hypothetical protein
LSSVYLRRSGCLYMYTGPTLPPEATSAPGTCLAEASLYSWSVPVQLNPTNVRIYVLCARHSHTAEDGCTIPISSDKKKVLEGSLIAVYYATTSQNSAYQSSRDLSNGMDFRLRQLDEPFLYWDHSRQACRKAFRRNCLISKPSIRKICPTQN